MKNLIAFIRGVMKEMNLPMTLQETGVVDEGVPQQAGRLADRSDEDQCTPVNPKQPLETELAEILKKGKTTALIAPLLSGGVCVHQPLNNVSAIWLYQPSACISNIEEENASSVLLFRLYGKVCNCRNPAAPRRPAPCLTALPKRNWPKRAVGQSGLTMPLGQPSPPGARLVALAFYATFAQRPPFIVTATLCYNQKTEKGRESQWIPFAWSSSP